MIEASNILSISYDILNSKMIIELKRHEVVNGYNTKKHEVNATMETFKKSVAKWLKEKDIND